MKLVFLIALGTAGALLPTAIGQVGGGGGTPLICSTNVTATPQLRSEGFTENTGDITITCAGGPTASVGDTIPQVNITIFFNTQVTSRLLPVPGSSTLSEALLLIDDPGSPVLQSPVGPTAPFGPLAPQSVCPTPWMGCVEVVSSVPSAGVPLGCAAGTAGCLIPAGTPVNVPTNSAQGTAATTNGYNVFQGIVNTNSVSWFGVPVLAPGAAGLTRTFRLTNIRINATALSGGSQYWATPVVASIAVSSPPMLPLSNPTPIVGFVQTGLNTSATNGNLFQCSAETKAPISLLTFGEAFGTAFKTRVVPMSNTNYAGQATSTSGLVSAQNVPGTVYNSESGFVYPLNASQTAGLADYGTRLKATFNNVNTGVRLFVSVNNVTNAGLPLPNPPAIPGGSATSPTFAQLVTSEILGDGTTPTGFPGIQATGMAPGDTGNVPVVEIPVFNGSATATWEILNTNPNTQETVNFAVFATFSSDVAHNSPTAGSANVDLTLAPSPPAFSAAAGSAASDVLPMPRFLAGPGSRWNFLSIYTCGPAIGLGKIPDAVWVSAGSLIGFTMAVGNGSPAGMATGVTLNDPLPAGPGINWSISPPYAGPGSCSISGAPGAQVLGCSLGDLSPGVITSVHVTSGTSAASCGAYSNTAMLAATNTSSLQATASTRVLCPSLSVSMTHIGNFTQAQNNATYVVTVSNAGGAGPTSGVVTLQEWIPAGLRILSMSGTGWTCYNGSESCFRYDSLAGGSSYPPITVTVYVAPDASSPQLNTVFVSGGGASQASATDSTTIVQALRFVPVTPCRLADTRKGIGGPTIGGGASRDFFIPSSPCGVPNTAQAYSLNVAVVPYGPLGYLTLWPTYLPRPLVSTLNSPDGRTKSNAAIVPAGLGGGVSIYASNSTDVVLDINGYFVPASNSAALAFFPVTPCRIADTRKPNAPLAGPSLAGGQSRTFPVRSGTCNLPAAAQAYSLNLTAVPGGPLGFVTAFPTGQTRPPSSNLNAVTGTVTANAALVQAGINGSIDVFASNTTDLVIDVNGYFAPMNTGGLSLYAVTPCRVLDTRKPDGSAPINSVDAPVSWSACGILDTAQAHILSVTAVPPGALGFLTLWPQGQARPVVSTLNALDGAITSNLAIVPTTNGWTSIFASNPTHLVLDLLGYFAQ